jgi:hypothetical protein
VNALGATRNGHIRPAAIALSFVVMRNGNRFMSGVDWRSEQAYANFEKAETVDIAWEWLRRDGEYHKDYGALAIPARLNGAASDFRHKWGLSFRS